MSYGSLITCSLISSSTCDSPVIDQPPVIVANPFVPRLSPHIHAHLLPKLSSSISALTDGSKLLGAKSELDHVNGFAISHSEAHQPALTILSSSSFSPRSRSRIKSYEPQPHNIPDINHRNILSPHLLTCNSLDSSSPWRSSPLPCSPWRTTGFTTQRPWSRGKVGECPRGHLFLKPELCLKDFPTIPRRWD